MSQAVPAETSRAIDVTRGLAALGVIWGHSMYSLRWPSELNGAFWVWVFLPLSGYLVTRGFASAGYGRSWHGAGRFLRNRGLRIVPLAWLALGIGAIVAIATTGLPEFAARQFVFLPPRNAMTLVGPLWTIATEMQFYVVAAALLSWALPRGIAARLLFGAAFMIASVLAAHAWFDRGLDLDIQPRGLVGNLPFLVWGVLLAALPKPLVIVPWFVKASLVVGLAAGAWYLQNHQADYFWRWGAHKGLVFGGAAACALGIALVVLWVGQPAGVHAGHGRVAWVTAVLTWCGVRTYGIYVWHALLIVVNNAVFHVPPGVPRLALLLGALPLAALSYRFFEQPFLRFKVSRPA